MSNKHIIDPDGNLINKYDLLCFKRSSDGSNQLLDTLKLKLHLLSNDTLYPNPFSQTTTFVFSVPSQSFISFQIFSLDSNIYSNIINDSLVAGSYKLDLIVNASSLTFPSGVYYFKQTINNLIKKRKFLLIR